MAVSSVSTSTSTGASVASTLTSSDASTTSSSEIDWSGLIESAVAAKLSKADTIDLTIESNEAKAASYQSASDLLATLLSAAEALRAPSGSSTDDVFETRSAYVTATGGASSSSLSATVEDGATTGTHEIIITQLAKAHKVAGSDQTSRNTDLNLTSTISLGVEGGTAVEISIDEGMTLDEIAEAINAVSDSSGVQASVLKIDDDSYRLVLSGTETGQTIVASTVSGEALATLGIVDENGDFADVLQDPAMATLEIDGIEITRSTNEVSDLIDGVTLHLYEVTATGGALELEVGEDLSGIKEAVLALVDAYNAYRDFAYGQQQLPSDSNEDSTVLFGDGTLRSINGSISDALATIIDTNSMALLGLSYDSTNNLVVDEDALDDALLTQYDEVKSLLSFQMKSSSSELMLLSRGTTDPDDLVLDVTVDANGTLTGASVGGNSSLFTVSGTRIIGAEGTAYEGYTFVYTGDESQSISLSFSVGLAERLYNATEDATNSTDGTLTQLIEGLDDTNSDLTTKSDDIRSKAETYRTNLTARYAAYQAAIEQAESVQEYLETLLETWNN